MTEKATPRDLLLESYPDISTEIDRGTVLMDGILDNSILNSTLIEYLKFRMGHEEAETSMVYRAALLTLIFRVQGKLSTPEEPSEPNK